MLDISKYSDLYYFASDYVNYTALYRKSTYFPTVYSNLQTPLENHFKEILEMATKKPLVHLNSKFILFLKIIRKVSQNAKLTEKKSLI